MCTKRPEFESQIGMKTDPCLPEVCSITVRRIFKTDNFTAFRRLVVDNNSDRYLRIIIMWTESSRDDLRDHHTSSAQTVSVIVTL